MQQNLHSAKNFKNYRPLTTVRQAKIRTVQLSGARRHGHEI